MAKLNARKIVAGLAQEAEDATNVLINTTLAAPDDALPPSVVLAAHNYREKVARLDKARGA